MESLANFLLFLGYHNFEFLTGGPLLKSLYYGRSILILPPLSTKTGSEPSYLRKNSITLLSKVLLLFSRH